jgi:hypothetical protein
MATLAELLALLPDNTTGEIGADDMRTVVTGVWDETELAVTSVNGILPDGSGDVEIPAATDVVKSVNGILPDGSGDVEIPPATDVVKSVNGILPDGAGDVEIPPATDVVKSVNGALPDVDGAVEIPPGITLIPEGTQPPLGSPPGIYGFVAAPPEVLRFNSISYNTNGTTVSCPMPPNVAVGDVVVFIPAFSPTTVTVNGISCSDAGWVEIWDYSANQSRKPAAYVYRVNDAAALSALGSVVTATVTDTGRRAGITYAIPGSLVNSAWPAFGSGSNRSAATINDNTTTGCTIQGFSTVTVPFHKVVLATVHDASASPAACVGFTEVTSATGDAGGASAITLTVLVKSLSAAPIPAASVTHATATTTTHGGGQFIVPVAV